MKRRAAALCLLLLASLSCDRDPVSPPAATRPGAPPLTDVAPTPADFSAKGIDDAGVLIGDVEVGYDVQYETSIRRAARWTPEGGLTLLPDDLSPTRTAWVQRTDPTGQYAAGGHQSLGGEQDTASLWTRDGVRRDIGSGRAYAVSSNGTVLGQSGEEWDPIAGDYASPFFLWTEAAGRQRIGSPPGVSGCFFYDVNREGAVVGHCNPTDGTTWHGFIRRPDGQWLDLSSALDADHSAAFAINDGGVAAGYSDVVRQSPVYDTQGNVVRYRMDLVARRVFRWSEADGARWLAVPLGWKLRQIDDVNETGDILGFLERADGSAHAFVIWEGTSDHVVLVRPGEMGRLVAINDAGQGAFSSPSGPGRVQLPLTRRPNDAPTASANGPYAGATGTPVILDSRGSSDADGDSLYRAWDFGDGITATGAQPAHTYYVAGTYTVVLSVTDPAGATSRDTATVVATGDDVTPPPNQPPVADLDYGVRQNAGEGQPKAFRADRSYDPEGEPLTFRWDFGSGVVATGIEIDHTYRDNGSFPAWLIVTDPHGLADTLEMTVDVSNSSPRLTLGAAPPPVGVGELVSVGAAFSDPGLDDGPWTYRIDWGDGSPAATGSLAAQGSFGGTHAYTVGGTYAITFTVRDKDGGEGSHYPDPKAQVTVLGPNAAPTAVLNASTRSALEGEEVVLDGKGSSDPEGLPLAYYWTFSEKNDWARGIELHNSYSQQGEYTVTLTVTDAGGASSQASTTITVQNAPPRVSRVTASPLGVTSGAIASVTAAVRDDGEDAPFTIVADWGDGRADTTQYTYSLAGDYSFERTHAYAVDGSYLATLSVRDKDGALGVTSWTIEVGSPRAPTAVAGGPYAGQEGSAITFDGGSSSDPQGGALTYRWDFGDGSTATGVAPFHAWANQGSYTVRLTVTDAEGLTNAATAAVSVSNVAPTVTIRTPSGSPTLGTGQALSLDAAVVDPGAFDGPWSWTIDWGDGTGGVAGTAATQSTPITGSHAYTDAGTFTVTVTAQDRDLGVGSTRMTVTVLPNDRPPIVNAGGPYTGTEGTSIAFSSLGSSDPDGGTLTYRWEFGDGTASTSANPTKTYADNGTFIVTLTVKDPKGLATAATTTAAIANLAPTASLSAPSSTTEAKPYTVALSSATDVSSVDRSAGFQYAFDCGDGAGYGAWGSATSRSCAGPADNVPSSRTLRAKAKDKDAGEREYTKSLTVTDVAPVVAPLALVSPAGIGSGATSTDPVRIRSGDVVKITGSFSDVGLADAPWAIKWAWDDGTSGTVSTSAQGEALAAQHTFYKVGTFKVYLQVTDKDAKYGRSAYLYVRVDSLPVAIDVLPGTAPNVIDLDAASNATIQVAVTSTPTLDATRLGSLRLGNGSGSEASTSASSTQRDVDGDGRLDLVASFSRSTLASNGDLTTSTTQLVLIGTHADGRKVRGTDAVQVVP
jgi:PKD repeat protein